MSVEVVCGPMFSGKSSYIHSIVKRYASIGVGVLVVKPLTDIRYSLKPEVVTHDDARFDCISIRNLMEIPFKHTEEASVIVVEEAQFFSDLVVFVKSCEKKTLIVVGLDGDWQRKPFGQVLDCIPLADKVTKLTAMCQGCSDGTPGLFTFRKTDKRDQVFVGGAETYSAYCRLCYTTSMTR
jgi:thymidine kinase